MSRQTLTLAALATLIGGSACEAGPTDPVPTSIAFTDVFVVPMDVADVQPSRTVLVREGRIDWIGPASEARIDPDALVIDGRGLYLMPGLADMHVHTWRQADQLLYIAYGVTVVRNMWGTETQLEFRRRIEAGELVGPTIVTAGPLMDGSPAFWDGSLIVTTPEGARQAVRDQAARGYDFVKPYDRLPAPVYDALVDEAAGVGLPVAGHVPIDVGLDAVIQGPQVSVEHLNRYSTLLQADPPDSAHLRLGESGWLTADAALMPPLADRLAGDGMWSVPTLILWERFGMTAAERGAFMARPEVRLVHPGLRQQWTDFAPSPQVADLVRRGQPARSAMVRALQDAGARLLLGTDVGNPFIVPGAGMHAELALLVGAGLSPYEALSAATRAPARFLAADGSFGVVRVGARADLILVEANPLDDVVNASRISGVMVRGQWFAAAELRRRLEEQAAAF